MKRFTRLIALAVLTAGVAGTCAGQDAREALGPRDNPAGKGGKHPLQSLMTSLNSSLLPALKGKHPRVFFTASEIEQLRLRADSTHKDVWVRALQNVRALKGDPPPPPAEKRRAQNEVGLAIAESAFIYQISGDRKYLAAAKQYMDAATAYEIWGYRYNKPNVDLAAGHLLYGMGIGYDLLYNDLSKDERTRYRDTLAHHARLMFDHYKLKPGRSFSYSQNHVFIPIAGLAVAAYALYDEVPDAPQWAALSRAIYDRVLATYSPDGYYYEGFEYWVFSTPWIIHYVDAHKHATGEDLYDHPGLKQAHLYLAHVLAPGGETMFDFGDVFEGPITRAKKGDEYERSHPGGKLHSNFNLLYRLAARYQNTEAQGIAKFMESMGQVNFEDWWSLAWYDDTLAATPMEKITPWHYFPDHEVVFWRTDWTSSATAFAFKAGPPEGHHTAELLKKFPDWHLSAGHAHPDANTFIIFAKGQYLTGDSGYSGQPRTDHHNTLLVDGRGQAAEGAHHDPWEDFSYDQLNQIRISEVQLTKGFAHVKGEAAAAYDKALGLKKFNRHFVFVAPGQFTVWDEIEAAEPRIFTSLLHSDTTWKETKPHTFAVESPGAKLVLTCKTPGAVAKIEPNLVVAPGQPGSVDKGEQQQRGDRVSVSTKSAQQKAVFVWQMKIQNAAGASAAAAE